MRVRLASAAIACAATIAEPSLAATVWDESTNGDLGVLFQNAQSIDFALGVNRVVGESHFLGSAGGSSDWDNDEFFFTIPSGAKLRAITLQFAVIDSASASFLNTAYQIIEWASPYPTALELSAWLINEPDPGAVINPLQIKGLDLSAPQYVWLDQGILSGYGTRWAYQYDFLVTSIPLPGTTALLALGLAALGLGRRR